MISGAPISGAPVSGSGGVVLPAQIDLACIGYIAPDNKPDYTAHDRRMDFSAESRVFDYTATAPR